MGGAARDPVLLVLSRRPRPVIKPGAPQRGSETPDPVVPAFKPIAALSVLAAALLALPVAAQPAPPALPVIRAIVFEGNKTTQPATMLREMVVHVGDAADPQRIEQSRQGVQDLGLFESVKTQLLPRSDGVVLVFFVEEKFYLLPAPRVDWNSNNEYAYGLQLSWNNVWGLNNTLRAKVFRSNKENGTQGGQRGTSLIETLDYTAPFVFDTPYALAFNTEHDDTPVTDTVLPNTTYRETRDADTVKVTRYFREGAASQGWRVGGGVSWSDQRATLAQRQTGMTTSLVLEASYQELHFNIYSDEGVAYSARLQAAHQGLLSDYDYNLLVASYTRAWYVGERPHQNFVLIANGGTYDGGPSSALAPGRFQFALGGARAMRGYHPDFVEGDTYYYCSQEFLTPVGFGGSLRALAVLEEGNAFYDVHHFSLDRVYPSAGLGLRLRPIWFVNINVEAGYAWPLQDAGDGYKGRFFAGGFRNFGR